MPIAKADKANWNTLRIGVNACKIVLQRLNEGISVLEKDDIALKAFGFANRAMMLQREHSIYALKRRQGIEKQRNYESVSAHYDEPKNRTWRAFQLGFPMRDGFFLKLYKYTFTMDFDSGKPI